MGYYDPVNHHRRSIRLKGYDYSQPGAYFVTMCTQGRECLFGKIENGKMILNDMGKIVTEEWEKSSQIRDEIDLGEWVVMPNHFHGIVIINNGARRGNRSCRGNRPVAPTCDEFGFNDRPVAPTCDEFGFNDRPVDLTHKSGPRPKSLASLMAGFKSAVTVRINECHNTPGAKIWQRNYYEHIIRTDMEFQQKSEYIVNNPLNWKEDDFYAI